MSGPELWHMLREIARRDALSDEAAELLRPAFAAMHGAEAIALPQDLIDRVRQLYQADAL
jgi:hypothetical protein